MKHRWSAAKRPRWPQWDRFEYPRSHFEKNVLLHCVQCGATKKEMRFYGEVFMRVPSAIFFALLGGRWKKIQAIPPCEGLPSWYEPPAGA